MIFDAVRLLVRQYVLDLPTATDALVDTYINEAIREAEQRPHNFLFMKDVLEFTTTEGTREVGTSTVFKAARGLPFLLANDGTRKEIEWAPSDSDMVREYPDAGAAATERGEPNFIGWTQAEASDVTTTTFESYPVPDGGSDYGDGDYRVRIPCWKFSGTLSDIGDTNWWTANYPWYVIHKATSLAMILNRDDGRDAKHAGLAEQQYQRARTADARAQLKGRTELQIRPGAYKRTLGRRRTL